MGRPNCVLPLNAEALAWEKEEDTTQVGKITEREVISNRARCLCLWSSGHSMRFFKIKHRLWSAGLLEGEGQCGNMEAGAAQLKPKA